MNVQRWAEGFRGGGVRAVDGEWVTYADHVSALAEARASAVEELDGVLVISVEECDRRVAEAEQRVRDEERSHFQEAVWTFDRGYRQGRAEALRQAREAVAAVELDDDDLGWRVGKGASLDALDALAAGPEAGR